MEEKYLTIMRNLFTALQAETSLRYDKGGIYEQVEKEKRILSFASGEKNCQILDIGKAEDAFLVPSAVTACASWDISSDGNGLTAVCRGCRLDGMSKGMKARTPCRLYCLNPIEGMIKHLHPQSEFIVESTLFEGENCTVRVSWQD